MKKLISTPNDGTLTLLRLVTGVLFFAHGAQKVFGWFGGPGLSATLTGFESYLHIPAPLAVLAVAAEFLGGLGLIFGLLGRVAAAGIAVNMVVAAALVHLPNGLFMNWSGAQKGEGIEYHLLALAAAVTLVLRGSGAWSLDRLLSKPDAVEGSDLAGETPRGELRAVASR
jgi:putative oxidoreductase